LTLVDVGLTLTTGVAGSADAAEAAPLVQTRTVVVARIAETLVDVDFASGAGEAGQTVTAEASFGVDTETAVFTRRSVVFAFVDVDATVDTFEAGRTLTESGSVGWVRVADGGRMTRVSSALVLELTQEAGSIFGTDTGERSDAVDANTVGSTSRRGTVVDVDGTVGPGPSVDAHAIERSVRVHTGRSILTRITSGRTFVHVLSAESAGEVGRTLAVIESSVKGKTTN
jgi:hypothetical protein